MINSTHHMNAARFGMFEADFARGELRKGGTRLKLPSQALQILQALVERPGELVTREELRKRLWPGDTFVDFDHGLNVMVNRLREVLGDSAKSPCYIETAPRRGYRFIAPLAIAREVRAAPAAEIQAGADAPPPESPVAAVTPRRFPAWWAAAALVVVFGLGGWALISNRRVTRPPILVPLTTFPGSKDLASFSPDGNQVAFTWVGPPGKDTGGPNRHIYIKLVDAGEPLKVTRSAEDETLPVWSPDGRYIAFLRKEGSKFWVYVVPALGGPERRICEAGIGLSWSPDGRTLAIGSPPDEKNRFRIVLRNLESGVERDLTHPEPYSDSLPVFSPDGRTIGFLRSFSASAREVMTVPASGGEPVRLTFEQRAVWGLAWTAGGRDIVYSVNRGGGEALWRVSRSGGAPRRVMVSSQTAEYPAISPSGTRLAYTEAFRDTNLYLYSGQRFEQRRPFANSTREDDSPQFSPDGEQVVFASKRTGSDEIWKVDREGDEPVRLTSFGGPATGSPRWSPDGRWIAFDSRAAGSSDIYVISADGEGLRRVTMENSDDVMPAWSADGKWLYFSSDRGGLRQIWKIPVEGGKPVQVTRTQGFECVEAPDGKLLYFSRDRGVAGIWTVPVNGGEERPVPELARAGYWRSWGVNRVGFYFVSRDSPDPPHAIRLFDFRTRQVRTLITVDHQPLWSVSGLAVSPDGGSLLYAQLDQAVNDLMMIENFR